MRFLILPLLCIAFHCGISQRLNVEYRTVWDTSRHFLTFIDDSNCRLTFSASGHVGIVPRSDFDLKYKLQGDIILFFSASSDTSNMIVQRLLKSRFIIKSSRILYDVISGYPYVDSKLINNKYIVYSIEGKIYRQNTKHKARGELKRKLKAMSENIEMYSVNVLRGTQAYDKYGVIAMNGIIEILRK